jgi:ketosteroid isomerase-like protein
MRSSSIRNLTLASMVMAFSAPCFAADMGTASIEDAWTKAMQANDVDAVMKLYAADAVAWFPNEKEARGEAAIRAAYEGMLSANTVVAVSISDTGHRDMGQTSAGWGRFSLTLQPKAGGDPIVMTGRFTEVAEQQDGQWVYIVDHASAEPAAMQPAMAEDGKK